MLRGTSRFIAGGAVIVVAVGTWIGVSMSSAHAQKASSGQTIVLYIAGGTETDVNVADKPTLAVGDEAIEAQPVFDAAHRTQQLGRGFVIFTIASKTTATLHSVISLQGGQIVLDGVKSVAGEAAQAAVTGGTGIYQEASGQASVRPAKGKRAAIVTIKLTS